MSKTNLAIDFWQFVRRDLMRMLGFAMVFGLIKLSGFSAALFLSNLMDIEAYATFEFALAAGLMLALPLNVGMQGAYPYFNLRLEKAGFTSIFYFHALWIGGSLLILLLLNQWFLSVLPLKFHMSILIGAIIALQVLFSAILKSHEKIVKAVFLDGGMFLVVNLYLLYLLGFDKTFNFATFGNILLTYLAFLLLLFAVQYFQNKGDFSFHRYRQAIHYGKHLVLSSLLIIAITNGARIFIEWFIDLTSVAYYAFYLRFALILLMIQQVFLISLFKKIYQSPPSLLDRYFAYFLMSILLIGLLLWCLVPMFLTNYFVLMQDSIEQYRDLFYILCFHTIFWAGLAFNENIIHREKLSTLMNHQFFVLILGMVLLLFAWSQWSILHLQHLAIVNLIVLFIAIEIQFHLLNSQRGFVLNRSRWAVRFCLSFFGLSYLWIS